MRTCITLRQLARGRGLQGAFRLLEARHREVEGRVRSARRALALAAAAALLAAAPAQGAALKLVGAKRLDKRLVELTFQTAALPGPTGVRVLTPKGYNPHGKRRYPVLYLLHGSIDDYRSWTD